MTGEAADGAGTVDRSAGRSYARHTDVASPAGAPSSPESGTGPMTTIAPHPPNPAQLRRIDEIFAARGASLVRAAHALTGNRPDAEDLLQEAFVRALARPEVFDGRSDAEAGGWLWIVMRRLWRDRQRGGLGKTSPMPAEMEQRLVDTAPPIPDQVLRDWQLAVLYEGLARLGPRHRTAMVLLGRGLGEVEAAAAAGVSRRTMREWRRDARRALGVFGERLGEGTICDGFDAHLSAYADGELGPGKQRTQLEAHLVHCAHCRASLEQIRTHTTTLGTVLPAASAVGLGEHRVTAETPEHIGQAMQVLGPPRVVLGGHDGLVAYAEAHWRLVATTAIVALTGWALIGNALGHLGGTGHAATKTSAASLAPPHVLVITPPQHSTRLHATRTHPTRHTTAVVRPATAQTRVAAVAPHVTTYVAVAAAGARARPTSGQCTSAACLFGP
jgi:RNA polymerase sigma-70 factor (ECF subfamily)